MKPHGEMEGQRDGEMEGRRDEGTEGRRNEGTERRRDEGMKGWGDGGMEVSSHPDRTEAGVVPFPSCCAHLRVVRLPGHHAR